MSQIQRRLPVGAEVQSSGGVHFRVWAPSRRGVEVELLTSEGLAFHIQSRATLAMEEGGYFSRFVPDAVAGALYRYRLDDETLTYPDPASRFQPFG
ncbi:MAG TPA: hypothetical protein VFI31_13515, partial [Pirellulales bacterium]|nr:hypothetical protein [Pirellulales bacterium]